MSQLKVSALKLSLKVDEKSAAILDGQSKICNWLYNHLLESANFLKKTFIETKEAAVSLTLYSKRGLRNLVPDIKQRCPFLKTVHSSPLKNVALRLTSVIQDHQNSKKGKRLGTITGWPKFRSWKKNWFSLLYDEPNKGFKVEDGFLTLSLGVGKDGKRLRVSLGLEKSSLLKNKAIRNVRIVKQNGKFEAVFSVTREVPAEKPASKVIVLDPNHKNLAYGVDANGGAIEIEAASWLKAYDKRLDELKRKRDRCARKSYSIEIETADGEKKVVFKESRRWLKLNQTIQKLLHKRREQTKTFVFTVANRLFKLYDIVAIGDYTPDGSGITRPMRRAMNNRSLIGRFKDALKWVAQKSGKRYCEFEEKGTTRTCSHCEKQVEGGIHPSCREWSCLHCGKHHIRDENAAQNGFKKIIKGLKEKSEAIASQVPGSGLVSIIERWAWRILPSGIFSIPQRVK
jgi:putative transposase